MEKYRNLKRSLAFLLCAVMLVSYMPSPAYALDGENADTQQVAAGTGDSGGSDSSDSSERKAPDTTAVSGYAASDTTPSDKGEKVEAVTEEQREDETPEVASGTDPPASKNLSSTGEKAEEQAAPEEVVLLAAGEEGDAAETIKVNFRDRDGKIFSTRDVKEGDDFGTLPDTISREDYVAYWAYGTYRADGQSGSWDASANDRVSNGEKIDFSRAKDGEINIVPYYEKITYTVNFYAEDKTTLIASRTVDVDTSYCLNDIPAVPAKTGHTGKWVYSDGDFSNSVVNKTNRSVWAEYDQTVFTVEFVIPKGDDKVENYETDTYYSGDSLTLPAEPAVDGKEFAGWYVGETQYVGGEAVTRNLTLTAHFTDEYSVRFVVLADDGETELETLSQYFRTTGDPIGTMPEDPFAAGKIFEKWVLKGTDTAVTKDTVVNENLVVVAKFRNISVYNITAKYFYKNDSGDKVYFNTDLYQAEAEELPYSIDVPATTQTDPDQVSGGPLYYAKTPSVTVKEKDFDKEFKCTVEIEYVKYTAEYYVVHMLKDLDGSGYTEIEREKIQGVLNSYVTPSPKTYDYAVLERAEGADITEESGQELHVYYNRKNFQLSYETNGGSYVEGGTYAYGSEVRLPAANPSRDGYDFAGWFKDEALTEQVSGSVTIESDTTLYAKWTGKTVNYTIVYMLEKYDNKKGTTSFVYDNSRTASGQVGTTVYASSAPNLTGDKYRGYERDTAFDRTSNVTIAADGSSVLVVHYKLIRYTLVFNINRSSGRITMGGQTYTGSNYRIENVVLGQDVSSMWPSDNANEIYDTDDWNRRYFEYWSGASAKYVTKRYELVFDMVSKANSNHVQTYTANWSWDDNSRSAEYWLQQPDGTYKREDAYNQFGLNTTSLNAKNIDGYTKHSGTPRGYSGSGNGTDAQGRYRYIYRFYYDRAQYDIEYYFGSTRLNTISNIYFDADISGNGYNYVPSKPESTASVDYSDYTWGGWYEDSALQTKYTFDKMPGHNLVLYAKWNAPEFKVSFEMDGGAPAAAEQTVAKYQRAEKPENPSKDGYIFEGWFTSADGDTLYDWNTQITADTTIYAHWSPKTLSYTVKYVDEENNEVAAPKTITNPNYKVGDKVEEKAIAVAGFRPLTNKMELTLTGGDDDEIVFVYVRKGEFTSYKVRYILDPAEYPGDAIVVADEKTVTGVPGDTTSVVELAAAVDYDALFAAHPELKGLEFHPDKAEKSLVLAATEEDNVLTFFYSSYRNATVTVNYVDMDGNPIADTHIEHLKVGKTFTLSRTPVNGWELNKAVVGTEYGGAYAR